MQRLLIRYILLIATLLLLTCFVLVTINLNSSVQTFSPNVTIDKNNSLNNAFVTKSRRNVESDESSDGLVIPVLVLVCDRVTVAHCLDKLLEFRPSAKQFPIIVSQSCIHEPTAEVIDSYGNQVRYIQHPVEKLTIPPKDRDFKGYYYIANHYLKALNKIFFDFEYNSVIIVEDDLEIAPDFYEYFLATLPILKQDRSLLCVSAWNDNGIPELIEMSAPEILHRTDFFPGLGWLLLKEIWTEMVLKWPTAYWDDWLRMPQQMKGRACIRPEISRAKHFLSTGVSGNYLLSQLKRMVLNKYYVRFTQLDLSYLLKNTYDNDLSDVIEFSEIMTLRQLKEVKILPEKSSVVFCCSEQMFSIVAKYFGLVSDMRSSIPRTAYKHVVTFMYKRARIFLVIVPKELHVYDYDEFNPFIACNSRSLT